MTVNDINSHDLATDLLRRLLEELYGGPAAASARTAQLEAELALGADEPVDVRPVDERIRIPAKASVSAKTLDEVWHDALYATHREWIRQAIDIRLPEAYKHYAEDLCQEVFRDAWRHRDTVPEDPRVWLSKRAEKRLGEFQRRRRLEAGRTSAITDEVVDQLPDLDDAVDLNVDISMALKRLSTTDAEFVRMYLDGFMACDIAKAFDLQEDAVRERVHRSLTRLRDIVQPHQDPLFGKEITMLKFTVELEFPPPRRVTKALAALLGKVKHTDIQFIDPLEDGGLVIRMICEAPDAIRAIEMVRRLVKAELTQAPDMIAGHPVRGIRATPVAEYEFVPLIGIAEIAELFGVTRQRASALAKTGSFPRPIQNLKMGPVFNRRAVIRYRNQRHLHT